MKRCDERSRNCIIRRQLALGTTIARQAVFPSLSAEVFSGKDYLKLAKSESVAAALFQKKLRGEETILYVISEKDQLALLPEGCVRVLVTAGLATIKERFAARMHGNLPAPVAAMLERKYGRFETETHDLRVDTDAVSAEEAANEIRLLLNRGRTRCSELNIYPRPTARKKAVDDLNLHIAPGRFTASSATTGRARPPP